MYTKSNRVTGQTGIGQNGTDKMARTKKDRQKKNNIYKIQINLN